jgi:hypothetical protein
MTMNRLFLRSIVVGFFLCLAASLASAQDNRTWVSAAAGVTDPGTCAASNICTRSAPCATFACALQATNPGGEIDALDSGDFGPLNGANSITKSVSIVADGVVAGIQQTGSVNAIDVTGSSVTVVLRGLTLDGLSQSGLNGIHFSGSGELHIEDCTINEFFMNAILAEPSASSRVFIKDTIVRNNGGSGVQVNSSSSSAIVTASLDNVRTETNSVGVQAVANGTVSVRNSVVAGNHFGLQAFSSSKAAVINLESSIVSGNRFTGIFSEGSSATTNMSNVTVVDNATGLSSTNGGQIVSFGNNKITDNGTNGSPTKTIAQH